MNEQTMLCRHCGEVLGMYEPVVVLVEGMPLRTSRLAAPSDELASRHCFHSDCFQASEARSDERDQADRGSALCGGAE